MTGNDVRALEAALVKEGYAINQDGVFVPGSNGPQILPARIWPGGAACRPGNTADADLKLIRKIRQSRDDLVWVGPPGLSPCAGRPASTERNRHRASSAAPHSSPSAAFWVLPWA